MTRAQWPSRCGSSRCRGGGSEKEQPIRSAAESGEKVGTLHRPAYQLQDGLLGVGQTGDVVVGDGLAVVHNLVHDPVDELLVESPQRFGVAAAAAGSRSRRPGAADSRLVRHHAGTPARGSLGAEPFICGSEHLPRVDGRSDAGDLGRQLGRRESIAAAAAMGAGVGIAVTAARLEGGQQGGVQSGTQSARLLLLCVQLLGGLVCRHGWYYVVLCWIWSDFGWDAARHGRTEKNDSSALVSRSVCAILDGFASG